MKTIILTTLALVLIFMSSVGQAKMDLKLDSSLLGLTLTPPESYRKSSDSITNSLLERLIKSEEHFAVPKLKSKKHDLSDALPLQKKQYIFDNMPCINPKINSNMPIAVPDSAIRYSIMIMEVM